MDASTEELRGAHDAIAELYAEVLADSLDRSPEDRAVLDLFRELLPGHGVGVTVADIGCGSGRVADHLARHGVRPHGVDLSPEMVRVATRDHPGIPFEVADLRRLPFADGGLAGAVAWYSLMYLAPDQRAAAFAEIARVLAPGGLLAAGFKLGDDTPRRGGAAVGVAFDVYWLSMQEFERRLADAGFRTVFRAERPPRPDRPGEDQQQGYLLAERLGRG
ncbi:MULTISPECIES: class I SAM-dependent DNA methyltransferase [Pseudonocardia]|uniref:class I SAM-dependent DNA methyltransferase n=1 Tax=Pseudonocardia TaxID=1847 RepID=UPI000A280E6C|nr:MULTISPECIES: class I SAM-dependent methyltransferase [Pseudonocardia]TDN76274.1 methyltransferase family protein [Pseudonocardia autotrophica]